MIARLCALESRCSMSYSMRHGRIRSGDLPLEATKALRCWKEEEKGSLDQLNADSRS